MFRNRYLPLAMFAIGLAGCPATGTIGQGTGPAAPSGPTDGGPVDEGPTDGGPGTSAPPPSPVVDVSSRTAQLKRKDGARLARDFGQALALPVDDLCAELGQYDCAAQAHRIVLGGVEPYVLRVDEPLTVTPVAAPIAVDRLALSACGRRVETDFISSTPVVFGGLVSGDPSGVEAAVDELYDRLLGRAPDPHERAALSEFAAGVPDPRDVAALLCFAIATTSESIFY